MAILRKNELAALGLVNRCPMHGYRLNQVVKHLGLEHWSTLSRSSIYNALRRLAKQGSASVTREREGNAPERTVYHITPQGHRLLADLLREAIGYVGPEDRHFYLGITFAEGLAPSEVLSILEHRAARLRQALQDERDDLEKLQRHVPPLEHALLMWRAGARHADVESDLCGKLIEMLRKDPDYFQRIQGVCNEM